MSIWCTLCCNAKVAKWKEGNSVSLSNDRLESCTLKNWKNVELGALLSVAREAEPFRDISSLK